MVKTGQQLQGKVAAKILKKEGSKEIEEDNQTTRWKEAKSNLEEEDKKSTRQSTKCGINLRTRRPLEALVPKPSSLARCTQGC